MEALRQIALSFPVVVFSALLPLVLLYWLLVLLRLAPLELFARDSLKGDHLASTMVALGFAGVPVTFALSVLLALAGGITLTIELAVLRWLPLGLFRIPVGVAALWAAFVLASPVAAGLCHALHRRLHRLAQAQPRCLLGEVVQVRSAPDAQGWATATLDDDPACEVRLHAKPDDLPLPGERRVLVKYVAGEGAYRSVAQRRYCEAREHLRRMRLARGGTGAGHGGAQAPL
ncbi:hypothetical protein HOP62_07670 [Halomonas sp. MCCC 1A17488]|uniref:hypothetical protein n=1 Tax=unclassified Halomonas TaxID=2609666 RepID=UPI0018D20829|nr:MULTISPECIES: hypothetical protein [unclassified Halomonas]MCE8015952.1 hypothetical protein [Halomonas sp. MCCC 1A17488]MCG3239285.1 hypothetical protein [Halomonas sp. MCCC 1A17488]QPP50782.1 hypothetical protein I4484_06715 [Halomonas sp. SS10-MC5]